MMDTREGMWQSVFHWVLPEHREGESLTKFRAHCQIALARWQVSREIEAQTESPAVQPIIISELCEALDQALQLLETDGSRHNVWHEVLDKARGIE